jgi:PKD repeat protein
MKIIATFLLAFCLFVSSFAQQIIEPNTFSSTTELRQVFGERYFFNNLSAQEEYSFVITPSASFSCLGLGWKLSNNAVNSQLLTFKYRTQNLNGVWSEWMDAGADFSPEDTPTGMYWTDLLFTSDASNHQAIEVVLTNPVLVAELVLDIFDGNVDSNPNHGYMESKHEDVNGGQRNCPAFPTIIPRSTWCGGSAPCSGVNASYTVTNISATHIVMHHGASPNTYTDGEAVVRSYWNYHVNTLGWSDIGYNYLIDKFGNFYQGRRNLNLPNQDVRGSHAGAANGGSIGVNFLGNLDVSIATTAQLNKLHEFLAWWFNHKSYDPLSSAGMTTQSNGWQTQPRFTHHNAIGSTSCPGTDMISRMSAIRNAAKAIIDACSTPPGDTDPPTTLASTTYNWQSNDFWVNYDDVDPAGGSGVDKAFYQVIDYNGTEWRGNAQNGFFNDNFTTTLHPEWTTQTGTWNVSGGYMNQTDQSVVNTNIHAALNQNNQSEYLYHWQMNISGSGTNKRAGIHFFANSPTLSNLGDSYMVYFRTDNSKCQIYRCTANAITLVTDDVITVSANQWQDCKITYNPTTGQINAYLNNQLASSYTDPSPIQTGGYFSLRTGECNVQYDDVKVRKTRTNQTLVTVGNSPTKDVRYESPNTTQDACRINTIINDLTGNWSTTFSKQIYIDWTLPTTSSTVPGNWQTADFVTTFTDADNTNGSGLDRRFYQVIDFDGADWRANNDRGFFSDNFDLALHSDWTTVTGTWNTTAGALVQTNEALSNTNVYAPLNQGLSNRYLYNFDMNIDGAGTNRRAGFHYFCDQPTLDNRGNSYFIWFRLSTQQLEFYKVSNDTFSQEKVVPCVINANQWYNISVVFDRVTGETFVYRDNKLIGDWKDDTPIFNGSHISFRTGNCKMSVDNLKIYRTRTATPTVTVGSPTDDIRYQNPNPTTFAAKVKSISSDFANNLSLVYYHDLNIDWTPPSAVSTLNDGVSADIDNQTSTTALSANWAASTDSHSGIASYWYSIGTSVGATNIVNWTNNGTATSFSHTGLSLTVGTTYYVNVRSVNGAGLTSTDLSSDGVIIDSPGSNPVPGFSSGATTICQGQTIQLTNTSTNATSYSWTTTGGSLSSTTDANPILTVTSSGTYTIGLTAFNTFGNATTTQNLNVTINQPPVANANPVLTTVGLGQNAFFNNTSTNASSYFWNFGNGQTSTDQNPWTTYNQVGTFEVMLIASNPGCENDTTYTSIQVIDASDIDEFNGISSLSIYPNPNDGNFMLNVTLNKATSMQISLFDITGKLVQQLFNETLVAGQHQLDMTTTTIKIAQGVYHLVIQTENGMISKKLVINN